MTPLEIFAIGKELWSLYEDITEEDGNKKPKENKSTRDTITSQTSWKYFKLSEFDCPCCDGNNISRTLVDRLDYSRQIAGVPFRITSGYRCVSHNSSAKVGGKPRSSHLDGLAVDIKASSGAIKSTIVASLFASGIKRVGIYKTFIHADISTKLPYPMLWTG